MEDADESRLRVRFRDASSTRTATKAHASISTLANHAPIPAQTQATICVAGNVGRSEMVGVRGFEPPTPASRTQYSTRLSYTPNCCYPGGLG